MRQAVKLLPNTILQARRQKQAGIIKGKYQNIAEAKIKNIALIMDIFGNTKKKNEYCDMAIRKIEELLSRNSIYDICQFVIIKSKDGNSKITINIITGATETNAEPRLLASVATLNTIPSFKRMA